MSWTLNPTAQREDMDAWLRGITDCLTPKTIELNAFTAQLNLSHQHVTHLQEELTRAQSRIDKLEVKVQDDLKTTGFLRELTHTQHCKDQLKASDEAEHETKTQVDKLQEALAVTERDKQELKTVQKHLENQLQFAEHQLEKAKADIESKNSKLTALEDHLRRCSVEIDHLTQQRDDANDELYAVRNELQHVFTQKPEPRRERPPSASSLLSRTESSIQELSSYGRSEWPHPKTSPAFTTELFPANQQREIIQPDSKAATGMTFKDLNQLAKNITQFDPNSTEGHCIQAYLQDIDFLLEVRPHMTDRDILYLLRSTSSQEVRSVLDRQPAHVKSNYQLLREILIKEFTSPESEHGVLVALETKQGRQETPQAYYHRFRQAYFGAHSKPESEEDLNFKTLFLRNLHPGLSRHLGIMACPVTMTLQQLRDLTHKAYIKQKMTFKESQDTSLALEDTQWHDNATVLHQEHRECYSHANDSYHSNHVEKSWDPPEGNNWNQRVHPKAFYVGKRQRNPPPHHTECVQEHDSLPSEDMERLLSRLQVFFKDKLNTEDQ
ncbi:hypothetical protein F2P79_020339 [Pimephales promelas]|nr:hypothetical protein F2P79_020339 [Pimephales promelas]KAG1933799.1 hypothetical protein F2P79_020339 [Pimephales promelas]